MAGQDTSSYNAVLRTVYQGGIREMIPQMVPVLDLFMEVEDHTWGGNFVEYEARVGRNEGSGWAAEDGALPAAGRQQYVDVRIPMRYHYGRIRLTKQVMEHSSTNKFAAAQALDQEMQGMIRDMAADTARTIFGDGRGILAFVNGTATSTTQTLDSPGGWAGSVNGARFINKTAIVGTINPATGQLRSGSVTTVQNYATTGLTITVSPSVTWTDNDYVVRVHNLSATDVADTSYGKEAMGLQGLVDDGTYVATLNGVNRVTYPSFASTVIGSVGPLSADVFQRAADVADERGGGDITDLIMHHSVRRAYLATLEGERRYSGSELMNPDGGTKAMKKGRMTFGGIGIIVDKYAPYGVVFAVDRSGFKKYTAISGEWMNDDGGAILKQIGTGDSLRDSYEAVYRSWFNFNNEFPNRSARLDGVSATAVVVHNE
ncbi:MAG TPA: phage major capsid protein [Gemmatimonadales bacterium]|nr:phage major capsid protein [Gemmatimonadales bacterium]